MGENWSLFFDFLKIAIGKKRAFDRKLSGDEWGYLYEETKKQALIGVAFWGIERLPKEQHPKLDMLLSWWKQTEQIKAQSDKQAKVAADVTRDFEEGGIRSCVLKGQSAARLYPRPSYRTSGDIDLLVDCKREKAVDFCMRHWAVDHVTFKDLLIPNYKGIRLEVHFIPTYFFNPFTYKKFMWWFKEIAEEQFCCKNEYEIWSPTTQFNLVYCLIHIYRHLFDEGIGLRQLMDYYYALKHSQNHEREEAYRMLCKLNMKEFAGATMYVQKEVFGLEEVYFICPLSEKHGKQLLNHIMEGGNFGKFSKDSLHYHNNAVVRGFRSVKHNKYLIKNYPSEILWSPIWKCWHWTWRKKNGQV